MQKPQPNWGKLASIVTSFIDEEKSSISVNPALLMSAGIVKDCAGSGGGVESSGVAMTVVAGEGMLEDGSDPLGGATEVFVLFLAVRFC